MIELTIAVGIVVVTSATCSLFEAVLYSVPVGHIQSLVEKKNRAGLIFQRLREQVDAPITAILSLNTVANTAGAAIAGAIAARVLGTDKVVFFSIFFTVVILLFAEVVPKTVGVVYSRPLVPFIAFPLQGLVVLFRPIIWGCGLLTKTIAGARSEESISQEELVMLARLGLKAGSLERDEVQVIENILSLRTKSAQDVLTPRTVLYALNSDVTVAEAFKDKQSWTYSRIPVYFEDLDDVTGIVYRRDILSAVAEDKDALTVTEIMKSVHFVLMTMKLDHVLRLFLERGEHMFAVIDEFGGLSGVITLEDILEEILGKEIVDEFDEVTDMRELARQRREALKTNLPKVDDS